MNGHHHPLKATATITVLFLAGLAAGIGVGTAAIARAQDPYAQLELFARVLTTIEDDYLEPVSVDSLVNAAIEGMMDELDHQSRWLTDQQVSTLEDETDGTVTGIGLEVRKTTGGFVITNVLPGSPGEREGVRPGDWLRAIDGSSTAELTLTEVQDRLRGPRGASARLTVERPGEAPRELQAHHDEVRRRATEVALLGDVAYARLVVFQEGLAAELRDRLETTSQPRGGLGALRGLIVDVRDNPGGLLTEAVAVTDLFLDEGTIVSVRSRDESPAEELHPATPGGLPASLPVVLLVNGRSASASEILAGALQDTGRGTLVGTRTYGKGTVQQVYRHISGGGSALKLTVGRYYTTSGQPVATGQGRLPDVVVPWDSDDDPATNLRQHISALRLPTDERATLLGLLDDIDAGEPAPADIPWHQPLLERAPSDPQLQRALIMLTTP